MTTDDIQAVIARLEQCVAHVEAQLAQTRKQLHLMDNQLGRHLADCDREARPAHPYPAPGFVTPWTQAPAGTMWTAFMADGRMAIVERLEDGGEDGQGAAFLPRISAFGNTDGEATGLVWRRPHGRRGVVRAVRERGQVNAPGAGSRARSRQIGYSQAMEEMFHVLRDGMETWKRAELREAEAGQMAAAAPMGSVRSWLSTYADYAYTAPVPRRIRGTVRRTRRVAEHGRARGMASGRPARRSRRRRASPYCDCCGCHTRHCICRCCCGKKH